MIEEFTNSTELAEMLNAILQMPSIADASILYGIGWILVLPPFLLAWGTTRITKAINLFGK